MLAASLAGRTWINQTVIEPDLVLQWRLTLMLVWSYLSYDLSWIIVDALLLPRGHTLGRELLRSGVAAAAPNAESVGD